MSAKQKIMKRCVGVAILIAVIALLITCSFLSVVITYFILGFFMAFDMHLQGRVEEYVKYNPPEGFGIKAIYVGLVVFGPFLSLLSWFEG